eukprot:934847-Pyramimonas_sp.AAC.2
MGPPRCIAPLSLWQCQIKWPPRVVYLFGESPTARPARPREHAGGEAVAMSRGTTATISRLLKFK